MTSHLLHEDTQVTLLLCGRFGVSKQMLPEPLPLSEYNQLASWLIENNLHPADLLLQDVITMLRDSTLKKPNPDRIEALLNRGASLALAIEAWMNSGLWMVGRSEESYPQRLKIVLKQVAPPILYGAGNQELLSGGGLAIVGSRDVDEEGQYFANRVAVRCARQDIQVVSGGARGVDREAMIAALDEGGEVIGVLANGLVQVARSKRYRDAIKEEKLVLVSAYDPNARFNIGNAMARNKHIYALSDWALVVSATLGKGGTWAGAMENLRHNWTPLFVRQGEQTPEGNQGLIEKGGIPVDSTDIVGEGVLLSEWFKSRLELSDNIDPEQIPLL